MVWHFWRDVHRAAFAEAAEKLGLNSRARILMGAFVVVVILLCLAFWGSADASRDEAIVRLAVAGAVIGLFPFLYLWKLVEIPARMNAARAGKNEYLRMEFPDEVNDVAKYGPNKRSVSYFSQQGGPKLGVNRSSYFLDLTNVTPRTIKNVSIIMHELKNPVGWFPEHRLVTRDGKSVVDIQPGKTEFFLIGFRHTDDICEQIAISPQDFVERLKSEWGDHIGFKLQMDGNRTIDVLKNDGSGFVLGVYGEDVPPSRHLFVLNCKNDFEIFYDGPLSPDESPLTQSPLGIVAAKRAPRT